VSAASPALSVVPAPADVARALRAAYEAARGVAPSAPAPAVPSVAAYAAALRAWHVAATTVYPQRGPVLRCLALALVCPVPVAVLLIGPPGTAKTTLPRVVGVALGLARVLIRTLSAWTDDAALLGPVDVAALASGTLRRVVGGPQPYLTDADLVVLDELPRAGRGVRDLCLSALADRVTPDGDAVPAHVIVATANTRLVDEDDRALVDRFALRVAVDRVTGTDLRAVIGRSVPVDGVAPTAAPLPLVPSGAVAALRAHAATVTMPGEVLSALHACAEALRTSPAPGQRHPDVSERRWILATRLLQASAALDGRDAVAWSDLDTTLPFVLDDGEDCAVAIRHAVASSIPAWVSALADLRRACDAAVALARAIEVDRAPVAAVQSQAHDAREATLQALAAALAEHGPDALAQGNALVADALDAADAHVAAGLLARKSARRPR
jgi:MoxR-like ATPase